MQCPSEANRLADHKRDGLGLRLLTVLVVVVRRSALCKSLVRQFMHKRCELLGLRLPRQDGDRPAVADTHSRSDVLGKDKLDAPATQ